MEANEFGKYLKSLREKAGLSMGKLAKLANVSQPYISQIESGQRSIPSPEILKKISIPLDVHYAKLLKKAGYLEGTLMVDGVKLVSEYEYQSAISERDARWERESEVERLFELYRWWMMLVLDKDGFIYEDAEAEFSDLFNSYGMSEPIYFEPYLFFDPESDEDVELAKKFLHDTIELCKEFSQVDHHSKITKPINNEIDSIDLLECLTNDTKVSFKSHVLSEDEKLLASGILRALFKDLQ
ncbi:helix-turn-helix domain-containing protein [Paenibacillus odorifer]|uniref:HTH cro/C1-type domain-containing protein n=1 Tax=Paenibacillus odorifer TaxID=189426 RepID=A0A1R0Y5P4_9BACL|nr:helix-turn-helix transcriptional regulator [Paenibacillus odorifer]OMD42576.1 hypothetical protein BSK52_07135 [Paenibacillus odorifer]